MCIRDSVEGFRFAYQQPAAVRVLPDAAVAGDRLGVVDASDAVSYTHLDVYKRQGAFHGCPAVLAFKFHGPVVGVVGDLSLIHI